MAFQFISKAVGTLVEHNKISEKEAKLLAKVVTLKTAKQVTPHASGPNPLTGKLASAKYNLKVFAGHQPQPKKIVGPPASPHLDPLVAVMKAHAPTHVGPPTTTKPAKKTGYDIVHGSKASTAAEWDAVHAEAKSAGLSSSELHHVGKIVELQKGKLAGTHTAVYDKVASAKYALKTLAGHKPTPKAAPPAKAPASKDLVPISMLKLTHPNSNKAGDCCAVCGKMDAKFGLMIDTEQGSWPVGKTCAEKLRKLGYKIHENWMAQPDSKEQSSGLGSMYAQAAAMMAGGHGKAAPVSAPSVAAQHGAKPAPTTGRTLGGMLNKYLAGHGDKYLTPAEKAAAMNYQGPLSTMMVKKVGRQISHSEHREFQDAQRADLSATERKAIVQYTNSSKSINGPLRDKVTKNTPLQGQTAKTVHHIDQAIGKSKAPTNILAHRVIDHSVPFFAGLKPGDSFVEPGYSSTTAFRGSFGSDNSSPVVMRIHIPEGHPALVIHDQESPKYAHEKEVLLGRNTKFEVVHNVKKPNGQQEVHVRVVPGDHSKPAQSPHAQAHAPTTFNDTKHQWKHDPHPPGIPAGADNQTEEEAFAATWITHGSKAGLVAKMVDKFGISSAKAEKIVETAEAHHKGLATPGKSAHGTKPNPHMVDYALKKFEKGMPFDKVVALTEDDFGMEIDNSDVTMSVEIAHAKYEQAQKSKPVHQQIADDKAKHGKENIAYESAKGLAFELLSKGVSHAEVQTVLVTNFGHVLTGSTITSAMDMAKSLASKAKPAGIAQLTGQHAGADLTLANLQKQAYQLGMQADQSESVADHQAATEAFKKAQGGAKAIGMTALVKALDKQIAHHQVGASFAKKKLEKHAVTPEEIKAAAAAGVAALNSHSGPMGGGPNYLVNKAIKVHLVNLGKYNTWKVADLNKAMDMAMGEYEAHEPKPNVMTPEKAKEWLPKHTPGVNPYASSPPTWDPEAQKQANELWAIAKGMKVGTSEEMLAASKAYSLAQKALYNVGQKNSATAAGTASSKLEDQAYKQSKIESKAKADAVKKSTDPQTGTIDLRFDGDFEHEGDLAHLEGVVEHCGGHVMDMHLGGGELYKHGVLTVHFNDGEQFFKKLLAMESGIDEEIPNLHKLASKYGATPGKA